MLLTLLLFLGHALQKVDVFLLCKKQAHKDTSISKFITREVSNDMPLVLLNQKRFHKEMEEVSFFRVDNTRILSSARGVPDGCSKRRN